MAKNDVGNYIDELRGLSAEAMDMDMYSIKKELIELDKSSGVFENFEKESMAIDKDALSQIKEFSLLVKMRGLASEIRNKNKINEKLHSLHFNLNLLKNATISNDTSLIKNALDVFLHNEDTKIENIIKELNDFKSNLEDMKCCHSKLLPKSLDNKIKTEVKYNKHIEKLHSVHKRQKDAFISTVNLFLKMTRKNVKKLNASLHSRKHLPAKI